MFKKATSIFTTPVPQKYNINNLISENNLTQMNLLVQDQLSTEINSGNCLSPPMFENDNESHNEENEQYQPSSSGAVDLSHATIHLTKLQILLVQQIVSGQQITNKLLTKLIMINGEPKPQSTIRQKCSEHFILPAQSVAEVCDIEEKLQLSASRQLMISRLQQCEGRSQNDTTTLILRTLLTDPCASNYNFEGRNSGKHAFNDLIMFSIVLDVTMMKHPTGSEDVVRCRIKNWLRLAPTRDKYKNNK